MIYLIIYGTQIGLLKKHEDPQGEITEHHPAAEMRSTAVESQNYQYYFVENDEHGRKISEWAVMFGNGHISIEDYDRHTKIAFKYPDGKFEKQETIEGRYTVCRGAEIKTKDATLSVYLHEYFVPSNKRSVGNLDLVANGATTSIEIPYKLAINIMNFMAGSVDVVGVLPSVPV